MGFKLALSAGHGKNTAGKRCLKSIDPNQTREWVLNSRIANKIEKLLGEYEDCEIIRLDDRTGVTDVKLATRSKNANNANADFYLAIHHNAGLNGKSGGGIIAFVKRTPTIGSLEWQKDLYNSLIKHTNLKGNRSTPLDKANFYEVKYPKMDSVLLELGFMDSPIDVPIILSEKFADQCAKAIVEVIVKRANLKKKVVEPVYSLTDFIKDVQKAIGAKVDGHAGSETLSKTITVSATINRKHPVVKPIQKRLYALGYKEIGEADGNAGPKFTKAVKAFQKDNCRNVDGEITARQYTWKKLLGKV